MNTCGGAGVDAHSRRKLDRLTYIAGSMVLVLGVGAWVIGHYSSSGPCGSVKSGPTAGQASSSQLCVAVERADLPSLLGVPGETVKMDIAPDLAPALSAVDYVPSVMAEMPSYTVTVDANYSGWNSVGEIEAGEGSKRFEKLMVLGRPAMMWTTDTGAGDERWMTIAMTPADDGNTYDLHVSRTDDALPDRSALIAVATRLLPAIPGFSGS